MQGPGRVEGDGEADRIRHRVAGVECFAQIELLGVAPEQYFALQESLESSRHWAGRCRNLRFRRSRASVSSP